MADGEVVDRVTDAQGASLLRCLRPDQLMLVLVRHGQRGGLPVDGLAGKSLTPRGHRQAQRVARRVAQIPLDHIYCSDMARAYQTAAPIRTLRPEVPFTLLPELRELSRYDQPPDYPLEITDLERDRLHQQRVGRFAERLKRDHHAGQVVLAVAHGGISRRLLDTLAGVPAPSGLAFAQHHASITVASLLGDGRVIIRLANCTRHLRPTQIDGDVLEC